ncbi:MAG: hypothetical protein HQK55_18175, partial [Deltaproteobacteria bacterium]|nr:hypothetical protein [Deltaproteobacteria bacterium]
MTGQPNRAFHRFFSHNIFIFLFLMTMIPAFPRMSPAGDKSDSPILTQAWPEADRMFHSDPLWLGGDGAGSVDLGGGRVLWLFGDSFVTDQPGTNRQDADFI